MRIASPPEHVLHSQALRRNRRLEKVLSARFTAWLSAFAPVPAGANSREKCYGALGALIGLLCTEWIGRHVLGAASLWIIPPMGASAVLLFAAPASPLAQPWSLMGGNVVSALVGVACALYIPDIALAAALACGLAIAAMFALRCLHPPGGAVALTAVLGGPAVAKLGFGFALWPVGINSLALLGMALLFNGLLKRHYPRRPQDSATPHRTRDPAPSQRLGFSPEDLRQTLAERGELLDISEEDLQAIVIAAETRAASRRHAELRCADIMSRDVVSVTAQDSLAHALALMRHHRLSVLPVLEDGRYLGLLHEHDAMDGLNTALADCLHRDRAFATPDLPAIELARPMADGRHCLPVLDEQGQLQGLVTQSDLIAALYQITLAQDEKRLAPPDGEH
ncbi:HPP family protein [Bordetella avium]|uniref:HPP family protein n=1 Tax=Bordetella avium TaxID=521 RepID=UPI000E121C74|nr:HPP family protein [Bordetella avium]WQE32940.1 HPP family protein [Bordetella avium]SUV69863.1 membrane protein [Bordetella avium]